MQPLQTAVEAVYTCFFNCVCRSCYWELANRPLQVRGLHRTCPCNDAFTLYIPIYIYIYIYKPSWRPTLLVQLNLKLLLQRHHDLDLGAEKRQHWLSGSPCRTYVADQKQTRGYWLAVSCAKLDSLKGSWRESGKGIYHRCCVWYTTERISGQKLGFLFWCVHDALWNMIFYLSN